MPGIALQATPHTMSGLSATRARATFIRSITADGAEIRIGPAAALCLGFFLYFFFLFFPQILFADVVEPRDNY